MSCSARRRANHGLRCSTASANAETSAICRWCSWSIASWLTSSSSFQAWASTMGPPCAGALRTYVGSARGEGKARLGVRRLLPLGPELVQLLVRLRELGLVAQVHRDRVADAAGVRPL